MENSSRISELAQMAMTQLEKDIDALMEKYPFAHRVAAKKWHYMKAHGYASDRLYDENSLLVYNRKHPDIWGKFDWWGKVTWKEGLE